MSSKGLVRRIKKELLNFDNTTNNPKIYGKRFESILLKEYILRLKHI